MTLADNVTARGVRAVKIGWFDFDGDAVFAWEGAGDLIGSTTGDPIIDANTFLSAENVVDITDIVTDQGSGGVSKVVFTAHDLAADAVRQIVQDQRVWRLRKVKIWQGFLMPDGKTLDPFVTQLTSGVMIAARMRRAPGEATTITIDIGRDLRMAGDATTRLTDGPRFDAADDFSKFMIALANGKFVSGNRTAAPGSTLRSIPNNEGGRHFRQQ